MKYLKNIFPIVLLLAVLLYSYVVNRKSNALDLNNLPIQSINNEKKLHDLPKKFNLIYFGFLSCPDFCPTTLSIYGQILNTLSEREIQKIQMIFITVDPSRDTLLKMQEYTSFFNSKIIPIWIEPKELERITRYYNIQYKKVILKNSTLQYTIDHSTGVILTSPEFKTLAILDHGTSSKVIIETIRKALKN